MAVTVLRVLAWVALAGGLLLALVALGLVERTHSLVSAGCWAGIGAFAWLCLLVAADGVKKARALK